jgi:sugar-specific transcriptional regulator TrmB
MRRKLHHLLNEAGLSGEEVRLYLLLLKLGAASVRDLVEQSSVNHMTAYRTVKRLAGRGLIEAKKINRKQSVYSALSLRSLVRHLETDQRKMRRLQLALQGLDRFLPFIDITERAGDNEPVEVREGLDAFREEYLKLPDLCGDEFLCMGSMQNYWQVAGLSDEAPEELAFRHKRYAHNTYARVFNTLSPESIEFSKRDSRELRTTRLVDAIPVAKDYLGYAKDHVRHFICDKENPRVVIIRHPELVALYRDQFGRMWEAGVGA